MTIRRLSLRETMETYKRFAIAFAEDPRRQLCGVVVHSSWHEPVACAYRRDHRGDHSWASIPALPHVSARARRALAAEESA